MKGSDKSVKTDKTGKDDRNIKSGKTALEAAYSYLANRMRTVNEVEKHLSGKGYSSEEITDAVNELIGMRYLDDYFYALRYYEYNREKKRGVMRAARELAEKGIDAETVSNAREDFLYENKVDEFSDALEIARKEVFAPSDVFSTEPETRPFDDKLAARTARRLESKGFSRSDIFRVLEAIRAEASMDQEDAMKN